MYFVTRIEHTPLSRHVDLSEGEGLHIGHSFRTTEIRVGVFASGCNRFQSIARLYLEIRQFGRSTMVVEHEARVGIATHNGVPKKRR